MMNLERIEKKLREARFFLSRMAEHEKRAFGDKEPFDFYLSAFVSAARSVDYRLRHEQKAIYPGWRETWDSCTLTTDQQELVKHLIDDRNVEVHESGSARTIVEESISVMGDSYEDASGRLEVFAPPGTPPAQINKPAYYFQIGETDRKAVDACREYLGLLTKMVRDFQAANP